jgi:hypothetical protein
MNETSSQEECKRIMGLGDEDAIREALKEGFDWDGRFDYDRYSKDVIHRCKYGKWHERLAVYRSSDIWRDKRLIRLLLDLRVCRGCGKTHPEIALSVHHKYTCYKDIPYESIVYDLTTLCLADCHEAITNVDHQRKGDRLQIEMQPHTSDNPRRGESHGRLENVTVPDDGDIPAYLPQRPTCRPFESLCEGDQGNLGKA